MSLKEYATDSGAALPEINSEFAHIPLSQLAASLTNPRTTFNPERLQELADSIKASGVHQPILVRPLPGSRVGDTEREVQFEIVAGERRFRACQLAGVPTIPAMVRAMIDGEVLEVQIVENLQRDDLTELEEAEGYERLMAHSTLTAEEVGGKIGKSRSYVYARLKLLDLCPEARASLRDGTIDASRALLLARIPDHKLQIQALEEVAANKDYDGELCYSYRQAATQIQRQFMLRLDRARFPITDASLLPGATACRECPKHTGHEPELFSDVDSVDVCTDPTCYHAKEEACDKRVLQQAHDLGQTVITGREAKALMPNSWGGVEGYLRLDDARDSPNDKPLRKLLTKQLQHGDIKPTLIANPHDNGTLIAVLPTATVAELLKAQGHNDAASRIDGDIKADSKAQALKEKAELTKEFEQGWRNELMKRTYAAIVLANYGGGTGLSLEVQRHIAVHFVNLGNNDTAKQLCKLLDLGTVAPKQALLDHIADHLQPEHLILLLIMQRGSEYKPWLPDDYDSNEALMLVAHDFVVSVDAVKAEVKKQIRAKAASTQKALATTTPLAQPPALPVAGANPPKPAKAAPRKARLSPEEAQLGIALALQKLEAEPDGSEAVPDGDPAPEQADRPQVNSPDQAAQSGFAVGQRVRVLGNVDMRHSKWIGKEGTVTAKLGASAWDVTFRGRNGGLASFDVSELEVVSS